MSTLFGLAELLSRRPLPPPEEHISVAELRATDAVMEHAGRIFRSAPRPGWLWCDGCGRALPAEGIKAHRCEEVV